MELFFDTETSGFISKKMPMNDWDNAWTVQLAAILSDSGRVYQEINLMIKAGDRTMHPMAIETHGITPETSNVGGISEADALSVFAKLLAFEPLKICHNVNFDFTHIEAMFARNVDVLSDETRSKYYLDLDSCCTMKTTIDYCKLPYPSGKKGFKFPKLEELYEILFNTEMEDAHDALADVRGTRKCYYELKRRGVI